MVARNSPASPGLDRRRIPALAGSTTPGAPADRMLAALDVHPRVAMQILRHSKIAITMEIYTEVPDARTREALRALGSQLGG